MEVDPTTSPFVPLVYTTPPEEAAARPGLVTDHPDAGKQVSALYVVLSPGASQYFVNKDDFYGTAVHVRCLEEFLRRCLQDQVVYDSIFRATDTEALAALIAFGNRPFVKAVPECVGNLKRWITEAYTAKKFSLQKTPIASGVARALECDAVRNTDKDQIHFFLRWLGLRLDDEKYVEFCDSPCAELFAASELNTFWELGAFLLDPEGKTLTVCKRLLEKGIQAESEKAEAWVVRERIQAELIAKDAAREPNPLQPWNRWQYLDPSKASDEDLLLAQARETFCQQKRLDDPAVLASYRSSVADHTRNVWNNRLKLPAASLTELSQLSPAAMDSIQNQWMRELHALASAPTSEASPGMLFESPST